MRWQICALTQAFDQRPAQLYNALRGQILKAHTQDCNTEPVAMAIARAYQIAQVFQRLQQTKRSRSRQLEPFYNRRCGQFRCLAGELAQYRQASLQPRNVVALCIIFAYGHDAVSIGAVSALKLTAQQLVDLRTGL